MRPRIIKASELTRNLTVWQPEERSLFKTPFIETGPAVSVSIPDTTEAERAARERGLAKGMKAAEEAYQAKLARLEALSASLQEERATFFDRVEPELVRLAVTIAEKIIGRELELRPELVVEMVQEAMKRVRERERLRVSVNPRDLEQIRAAREDLLRAVDGVRKLDLIEDRRVDSGGCLIESENGTLDARISTQLAEIGRALEGVMPEGDGDGTDSGLEPVSARSRSD